MKPEQLTNIGMGDTSKNSSLFFIFFQFFIFIVFHLSTKFNLFSIHQPNAVNQKPTTMSL